MAEEQNLSTEIPRELVLQLDAYCRTSGRKKKHVVGAAISRLLQMPDTDREGAILKYIDSVVSDKR